MTHPNNVFGILYFTLCRECQTLGDKWASTVETFYLSVPSESNQLRLKMSRYPFNKADTIKLFTSCSVDQPFGISEDYMKGLLWKPRTLITSLQKLQLQRIPLIFQQLCTEKDILCRRFVGDWVNGTLKAGRWDHRDNGVFCNSLQPFRRLFLKQWQPL